MNGAEGEYVRLCTITAGIWNGSLVFGSVCEKESDDLLYRVSGMGRQRSYSNVWIQP